MIIEELKLIQEIVGDLSAVGGWVAAGVIAYKMIINLVLMIGGGWLLNSVITKLFSHLKADITREEANDLKSDNLSLKSDMRAMITRHDTEMNEIKAMYKILKEAKGNE